MLTASKQVTKVEKSSWASCCSKLIKLENDWRMPNKDMTSRLSLSFPSLISTNSKGVTFQDYFQFIKQPFI